MADLPRRLAEWAYNRDQRIAQKKMEQTIKAFHTYVPPTFSPEKISKFPVPSTRFSERLENDLAHREIQNTINEFLVINEREVISCPNRKSRNKTLPRYHLPRRKIQIAPSPRIPQVNQIKQKFTKTITYTSLPVFERLSIGRKNMFLETPVILE